MKVSRRKLVAVLAVVGLGAIAGACGGLSQVVHVHHALETGKRIAVVQYVCEWRNTITGHSVTMGIGDVRASIDQQASWLVEEIRDNTTYEVVAYSRKPAGTPSQPCTKAYLCPSEPIPWESWTGSPDASESESLPADSARALAAAHEADAVLVVYSFWRLAVGFSKDAVAETKFKLYAADGTVMAGGETTGKESAGVFPSGQAAVESFALATKQSFHELAIRLSGE